MFDLCLRVLAVLAAPHPDVDLLLVFEEHFIVDVVEVRPLKNLHLAVLEDGLDCGHATRDSPRGIDTHILSVVDAVLVEGLHVLVDVAEDTVQVEDEKQLYKGG